MKKTIHELFSDELTAAQSIMDGAKAAARALAADEREALDNHLKAAEGYRDQIKQENEQQARLKRLDALARTEDPTEDEGPTQEAKDFAEHFMKTAGPQLAGKKGTRFSVSAPEFKAATPVTTQGLVQAQFGGPVPLRLQRPTIADVLLSGTITNGNAYTYFQEGPTTGGPAAVAESSLKPELSGGFTPVTESLAKIAGWTKESDELLEDFPALESVVRGRLVNRLVLAEETQILSGSGTAPNMRGLLNRSGIQTETQGATGDSALDALFRAITKVQTGSQLPADFIVLNPADYQTIRLAKATDGTYLAGSPFSSALFQNVWGLPTIVTSAIAAKTALVGSSQAAQVFSKGGVRVDVATTNEDDFINNRITVLAEERKLLAVYYPAGLVKVTLAAAA